MKRIGRSPLNGAKHLIWDDIIEEIMDGWKHFEVLQEEHEMVKEALSNAYKVKVEPENKLGNFLNKQLIASTP